MTRHRRGGDSPPPTGAEWVHYHSDTRTQGRLRHWCEPPLCSENRKEERLTDNGRRLTELQLEIMSSLPADRRDTFAREMMTANQRRERFLAAFVRVEEGGDEQHG